MMNDDKIKSILVSLYEELKKPNANQRLVLFKAFCAGQKFQEEKIKQGINIVFDELHG